MNTSIYSFYVKFVTFAHISINLPFVNYDQNVDTISLCLFYALPHLPSIQEKSAHLEICNVCRAADLDSLYEWRSFLPSDILCFLY